MISECVRVVGCDWRVFVWWAVIGGCVRAMGFHLRMCESDGL